MGELARKLKLLVSGFFALGFAALSIITLLPAGASKPNLLGYYGVCPFAPKSTATLILFAVVALFLGLRVKKTRILVKPSIPSR